MQIARKLGRAGWGGKGLGKGGSGQGKAGQDRAGRGGAGQGRKASESKLVVLVQIEGCRRRTSGGRNDKFFENAVGDVRESRGSAEQLHPTPPDPTPPHQTPLHPTRPHPTPPPHTIQPDPTPRMSVLRSAVRTRTRDRSKREQGRACATIFDDLMRRDARRRRRRRRGRGRGRGRRRGRERKRDEGNGELETIDRCPTGARLGLRQCRQSKRQSLLAPTTPPHPSPPHCPCSAVTNLGLPLSGPSYVNSGLRVEFPITSVHFDGHRWESSHGSDVAPRRPRCNWGPGTYPPVCADGGRRPAAPDRPEGPQTHAVSMGEAWGSAG